MDYKINSWNNSKNDVGTFDIDLEIVSIGDRYMPLLIETELEDGTLNRRWWENHLWRTNDTISYSVASKPIRVTLDPDGQTMDVDLRNNSLGQHP